MSQRLGKEGGSWPHEALLDLSENATHNTGLHVVWNAADDFRLKVIFDLFQSLDLFSTSEECFLPLASLVGCFFASLQQSQIC